MKRYLTSSLLCLSLIQAHASDSDTDPSQSDIKNLSRSNNVSQVSAEHSSLPILNFPNEIIRDEIIPHLDWQSKTNLARVNKKLSILVDDSILICGRKEKSIEDYIATLPGHIYQAYKLARFHLRNETGNRGEDPLEIAKKLITAAESYKDDLDALDPNIPYTAKVWQTSANNWKIFSLLLKLAQNMGSNKADNILSKEVESRWQKGEKLLDFIHQARLKTPYPQDSQNYYLIARHFFEQAAWAGGSKYQFETAKWFFDNAAILEEVGAAVNAFGYGLKWAERAALTGKSSEQYFAAMKFENTDLKKSTRFIENAARSGDSSYKVKAAEWFNNPKQGNSYNQAKYWMDQAAKYGNAGYKLTAAGWFKEKGEKELFYSCFNALKEMKSLKPDDFKQLIKIANPVLDLSISALASQHIQVLAEELLQREQTSDPVISLDLSGNILKIKRSLIDKFLIDKLKNKRSFIDYLEHNSCLRKLYLENTTLNDETIKPFLGALMKSKHSSLESLDLSVNKLTEKSCQAIGKVLVKFPLGSLALGKNYIGDEGADQLANSLSQAKALQFLFLNENKIRYEGLKKILDSLQILYEKKITLQKLDISGNDLRDAGLTLLASAFVKQRAPDELILSQIGIGANSVSNVCRILEANPHIKLLDLSNNQLNPDLKSFQTSLRVDTNLRNLEINLSNTGIDANNNNVQKILKDIEDEVKIAKGSIKITY